MARLRMVSILCVLAVLALTWGHRSVLAQQPPDDQSQVITAPRKEHDVEYVKQRQAQRRLMTEQRKAAAERYRAEHGQTNSYESMTTNSEITTDQSGRGN